jgi:hypothetical protein
LVPDSVGLGLVASLRQPGGNITDYTNFEFAFEKNDLCVLGHSPPPGKTVMSPPWTSDEQPGLLA